MPCLGAIRQVGVHRWDRSRYGVPAGPLRSTARADRSRCPVTLSGHAFFTDGLFRQEHSNDNLAGVAEPDMVNIAQHTTAVKMMTPCSTPYRFSPRRTTRTATAGLTTAATTGSSPASSASSTERQATWPSGLQSSGTPPSSPARRASVPPLLHHQYLHFLRPGALTMGARGQTNFGGHLLSIHNQV